MVSSRSLSSLAVAAAMRMSGISAIDIPGDAVPSAPSLGDVTSGVNLPDSIPGLDLQYYKADIVPLGNGTVTGTVYVKADPFHSGSLVYGGNLLGLQPSLMAESCTATNGCGVHIHAGHSCNSTAAQLGHFFDNLTLQSDPWINERYSSNGDGVANFASRVDLGTADVGGRVFVVHSGTGTRVACGILREQKVATDDVVVPPVAGKPFAVCQKAAAYRPCKDRTGKAGILMSKKLNRQYRSKSCKQECVTATSPLKDPSYLLQRGWACGPCPKLT
jgi:hypothetical protein